MEKLIMEIKIGGYYRTQRGVIFGAVDVNHNNNRGECLFKANGEVFKKDGKNGNNRAEGLDLVEDVTHFFKRINKSEVNYTFPTWEEFWEEFSEFVDSDYDVLSNRSRVYDYFRTRIQPLEESK
jgi:hypothetical protein